jgi:radical SAM superfamily enzyme YgiQ (UPF0313 family)
MSTLVLVVPPLNGLLDGFSSGLIAAANYVQRQCTGVSVLLLDLSATSQEQLNREITQTLKLARGRAFVGITTTTASYQSALRAAQAFKDVDSECIILLGGHHASPQADVILEWQSCVDFVIRGEGEKALASFCRSFPDISAVPNLTYRAGDTIVNNPETSLLTSAELDQIPPYFHEDGYVRSAPGKFNHATYVSARGCPLSCAFCAVANEKIRHKSTAAILDDLKHLIQVKGCASIAIEDNFFAHSLSRTLEVCSALERLQSVCEFKWDCQTRVESLCRGDVPQAMARAGCEAVYIGVEAFDPEQLRYLGKTNHPGNYIRALEEDAVPLLVNLGIKPYVNVQVALPNERVSQRHKTLQSLKKLGRSAQKGGAVVTVFPQLHVIYPGTGHWMLLQSSTEFGKFERDEFEDFTAWEYEDAPVLKWLGRRFAHGTGGIPIGILDKETLRTKQRRERYRINPEAVLGVENYLEEMAALPGIQVFRYAPFLAGHIVGA